MGETPPMRWWGWGDPAQPPALGPGALELVLELLGMAGRSSVVRPRPPVVLARVRLAPGRLPGAAREDLLALLGGREVVREGHEERVVHAAGKGYPDLVRLRAGEPEGAPDAVLYPSRPEQLRPLLELLARHSVAVVPFGGGTSVVGGVAPLRGEHAAVVSLDMRRLGELVNLDTRSRVVTVQAGMRAPALERLLASSGLTLGHFPQSFEYVSLGGCAATRSAGQASTGYGRFEELVLGLRVSSARGEIALGAQPASAAGPDLRGLLVGSEGTLGVIGELDLRVRAAPLEHRLRGVLLRGLRGRRRRAASARPGARGARVARLSDEAETRMSLAQAGADTGGLKGLEARLGRAYLRARGRGSGCLAILGFEGAREELERERERAIALVRGHGGLSVGRLAGGGVAQAALRGALPARRAAHPWGHGRDARDRHHLGQSSAPARARPAAAIAELAERAGNARAGDVPRLPSLRDGRLAVLHGARPPARGRGDRAVAGGQAARRATRSRCTGARSPTTMPSGATTSPGWWARSASRAWRRCVR